MTTDHTTIPRCPAEDCTRGRVIADDWAAPDRDCEVCCGTGLAITAEDVVAGRVPARKRQHLDQWWWEGQAKRLVDDLARVTAERDAWRGSSARSLEDLTNEHARREAERADLARVTAERDAALKEVEELREHLRGDA